MRTTCDQCKKTFRGAGHRTATRVLCEDCHDTHMGLVAGQLAGDGSVADTISIAGWYKAIRKARKG